MQRLVKKPLLWTVKEVLREVFYLQWVLTLTMGTESKSFVLILVALFLTSLAMVQPATVKAQSKTIVEGSIGAGNIENRNSIEH